VTQNFLTNSNAYRNKNKLTLLQIKNTPNRQLVKICTMNLSNKRQKGQTKNVTYYRIAPSCLIGTGFGGSNPVEQPVQVEGTSSLHQAIGQI
jgi:hypothetical protein